MTKTHAWKYFKKYQAECYRIYAKKKRTIPFAPCVQCGTTHMIHNHHWDYSKPMDTIPYCVTHHLALHKNLAQGGFDYRFEMVKNCEPLDLRYEQDGKEFWPLNNCKKKLSSK
jgi:hypothetical protein